MYPLSYSFREAVSSASGVGGYFHSSEGPSDGAGEWRTLKPSEAVALSLNPPVTCNGSCKKKIKVFESEEFHVYFWRFACLVMVLLESLVSYGISRPLMPDQTRTRGFVMCRDNSLVSVSLRDGRVSWRRGELQVLRCSHDCRRWGRERCWLAMEKRVECVWGSGRDGRFKKKKKENLKRKCIS